MKLILIQLNYQNELLLENFVCIEDVVFFLVTANYPREAKKISDPNFVNKLQRSEPYALPISCEDSNSRIYLHCESRST